MTIRRAAILVAIGLPYPPSVLALDQTQAVTITELIRTRTSRDGNAIAYPQGKAEVTGMLVESAPAGETGWHVHPVPSFAYVLDGTLEVTLKDGRVKRLQAGEALAEVVDTSHNGRNVGDTPVKLVVFYAGAAGQPLTIRER